uniref:Uncharacterized protein n=1 Tax=Arundo donax TaxID=35708 RepID=A0A0A9U811_ARUDO
MARSHSAISTVMRQTIIQPTEAGHYYKNTRPRLLDESQMQQGWLRKTACVPSLGSCKNGIV